jgi:hypothetical protein
MKNSQEFQEKHCLVLKYVLFFRKNNGSFEEYKRINAKGGKT